MKTIKSYVVISKRGVGVEYETHFDNHPKQPDRGEEAKCYANSLKMDKNNVTSVTLLVNYSEEIEI